MPMHTREELAISDVRQELVDLLSKWRITVVVMGSLLMQLLLLLTGGMRKWSTATRFVAWIAYNWSDYVATSALGAIARSAAGNAHKLQYAIWAPMLLLHLGAPDNISAYSMADAELWLRHMLTMLLQTATVIFVVANCAHGSKYVLLSICLTALGSIKYAERIIALKCASRANIIESALPIYKYMLAEPQLKLDIKGLDSPSFPSHPNRSYYYIIRGEKEWLRNFLKAGETNYVHRCQDAAKATPRFVTMQDVLSSQQLREAAPSMVLVCAGFALFKLYKRRLSGLYMYEWREEKTHELFMERHVFKDVKEIRFVLDVELGFLFDSLYTKAAGTAFSKLGVSFRMLTTILLVVAGVFIFGSLNSHDKAIEQGRNVTVCLIAAAVIIEAYQLARLALSDWSRVWLVCAYIDVGEQLKNRSTSWGIRHSLRGFWLATLLGLIKLSSIVGRHKYWRSRIGQYAMVDIENPSVWRHMIKKLASLTIQDQLVQLVPEYVHGKQAVEAFKSYVLTKALETCRGIPKTQQTLHPAWFLHKYDQQQQQPILQVALGDNPSLSTDLEHLVVNWHVATCVCEVLGAHDNNQQADSDHVFNDTISAHAGSSASPALAVHTEAMVDLQMSKLLSRYMMYLLVHKAELLPCHADIARQTAAETQRDMSALTRNTELRTAVLRNLPSNLRCGMKAGSMLQALPSDARWRFVARVWVDLLVGSASANKPNEHLHQLTLGGEVLTHLWVLMGHMGYGSQ